MAANAIESVREAETKAEEILREAASKAAKLVDDAQTEALRTENTTGDAARAKAAEQVAAAHQQSQKELEQAMADLNGEMDELSAKARANQSQAVRAVLEALV